MEDFAAQVAAQRPLLVSLARRHLRNDAWAEDAVSETLVAALERPDLLGNRKPRVINHAAIGDALTAAQPPVRAVIVYNNNPVAVCPDSEKVLAGFRREDLFCVVMDSFLTDTADYADYVLPATTQLEHADVHKSYGHLYVLANNPAIAPLGEAKPMEEALINLTVKNLSNLNPHPWYSAYHYSHPTPAERISAIRQCPS